MTTKLQAIRLHRNLSIHEAANLIGMSAFSYKQIEVGLRDPSLRRLKEIAAAFSVPVAELIDDVEPFPHVTYKLAMYGSEPDADILEVTKIMQNLATDDRLTITELARSLLARSQAQAQ